MKFLLSPEIHISAWEEYAAQAKQIGAFEVLKQRLVQLRFPIELGISKTEAYRYATRRGAVVDDTTNLILQQPEKLKLIIHQSIAGAIPVLLAANRQDFVSLVQALTKRNEPEIIPPSMGACIVTGFNNWDRIFQYRQNWKAKNPNSCSDVDWTNEFRRILHQKELYQDRFIILSDGFYSNISADEMNMSEPEWRDLSLTIRLEHECTHYLTYRLLGSMGNNILDELIADYRGIVAAIGHYRSDWFLRFVGLESFPYYRLGSRLENYRSESLLSNQDLHRLVKAAAENLQQFDTEHREKLISVNSQILMVIALSELTLEELASFDASDHIQKNVNKWQTNFAFCYE